MEDSEYYKKLFKGYLDKTSIDELLDRIEKFREIDLKTISDKELKKRVKQVISYNLKNKSYGGLVVHTTTFKAGTPFYRIRKFETTDLNVARNKMQIEKDAWEPPIVKYRGRLNNIGESLLYTCPFSQETAVKEMKIREGEIFALMTYRAKENIEALKIGEWKENKGLTKEQNQKLRIINNFLYSEFTKDVGVGTEYLYRVSEIITKDYFNILPLEKQQAWCYPSVQSKQAYNVCFRPKIHREVLELKGVSLCIMKEVDSEIRIGAAKAALKFDDNGKFVYVAPNDENMKVLFPHPKSL